MACTTIVVVITLGQNVLLDAYWNASVLMAAWKCCGDSHSATLTNRNFAFGSKLSEVGSRESRVRAAGARLQKLDNNALTLSCDIWLNMIYFV